MQEGQIQNRWGELSELGVLRKESLDAIFERDSSIKVLCGLRRAGKSYLLRQVGYTLIQKGVPESNIIYINKDSMEVAFPSNATTLKEYIKHFLSTQKPKGKVYLLLDDTQYISEWETVTDNYIPGNYEIILVSPTIITLSKKFAIIPVFPFSFTEYIKAKAIKPSRSAYIRYMSEGGLPELLYMPNDHNIRCHYVSVVKDTTLLRNVIHPNTIKDTLLLEEILMLLLSTSCRMLSIPDIVKHFSLLERKTNYETVSVYLSCLENAFLIARCERRDVKNDKIISGQYKFYANDLAFRNICPSHKIEQRLENAVYLELIQAGFDVYTAYLRNKEIDFLAVRGGEKICLQVINDPLSEAEVEYKYTQLKAVPANYTKLVVSTKETISSSLGDISHINIWSLSDALRQGATSSPAEI